MSIVQMKIKKYFSQKNKLSFIYVPKTLQNFIPISFTPKTEKAGLLFKMVNHCIFAKTM